jgi:type II secretory pathway pseudopilin PulG
MEKRVTRAKPDGRRISKHAQRGYILLTLMLAVCLFAIAVAVAAPTLAFQIRRDREEELIHRGAQYSRAIRWYAKKTGRYPLTLDELYQPGGVKYIRRLYKDPVTGRDFRLLHTSDIMSATGAVDLNSHVGENPNGTGADPNSTQSPAAQDGANPSAGTQPAATAGASGPAAGAAATGGAAAAGTGPGSTPKPAPDDPTHGVIYGVASTSKKQSIREFDHKNHYNQWLFFYDLNHERGSLITGPTSLTLTNTPLVGQPAGGAMQPPGPGQQPGGQSFGTPQTGTPQSVQQ